MQITWGIEWEYGSKPFTHTATTSSASLTSQHVATCASRQTCVCSQWLCFSLLLTFARFVSGKWKTHKMKSRIRSSGWFLIKAGRWGPTKFLYLESAVSPPRGPSGTDSAVCLENWYFCLNGDKYNGGRRAASRGGEKQSVSKRISCSQQTGENPASP